MTLQELLAQPVVRAAIAPFIVAFFVAVLARAVRLSGLATIAGFGVCAWLIFGGDFTPLDPPRRIALATAGAAAAGLLFDFINPHAARTRWLIAGGAAAVLVWALFPTLATRPGAAAWGLVAGLAVYAAILVGASDAVHSRPINATAAATTLCLGTGLIAVAASAPLMGQLAFATGFAGLAMLTVQMLTARAWPAGRAFALPTAVCAALVGASVVASGKVSWPALATLIAVPLLAGLSIGERMRVWVRGLFLLLATGVFAAAGAFIAWREVGSPWMVGG